MMNTIYLISYNNDPQPSTDYATSEEGIKRLTLEWYWTGWKGEKTRVEVNVDMENRTVTVYDPASNDSITYDILKFVREA